jgi:beta-lactamase family protein
LFGDASWAAPAAPSMSSWIEASSPTSSAWRPFARQKPAWEPGTRQAYQALTLGFYEGGLLRRVDPQHRSLGQFFQGEVASRLGEDVYIRLPQSISNARLATLARPGPIELLLGFPLRLALDSMNPRSNIYRALIANPGAGIYLDAQCI